MRASFSPAVASYRSSNASSRRRPLEEGEIEVDAIHEMSFDDLTSELARYSGFRDLYALLKVAKHGDGENVYLVKFHYIAARARPRRR